MIDDYKGEKLTEIPQVVQFPIEKTEDFLILG